MADEQASSTEQPVAPQEPKEPSRAARFFRRALRWAAGILAVFTIGFLVTWYAQVAPKAKQIESLSQQLSTAEGRVGTLEDELEQLQTVRQENQQLREELDAAQARLGLLSVLVDVSRAQLGVAQEDPVHALAALDGTEAKLAALETQLSGGESQTVHELGERLQLVLDEVESDIFAAQRDLEVLANRLLTMDSELFDG